MKLLFSRKFTFFLFLFFSSLFAEENSTFKEPVINLKYSIRPLIDNNKLEVTMEFQGDKSGMTEIILPSSWGGQERLYLELSDVSSLSENVKIENTLQPERKKIYFPPNETIQIKYYVTSLTKKMNEEWYYRPQIHESYFFFLGHAFFIIPKIDSQLPMEIDLEWLDFPPEWQLASSFGANKSKYQLHLPLDTFLHSLFLGGDFQILKIGEESPFFLAFRGERTFSDEELINLATSVVNFQRDFWNDHHFPYYLITLFPIGEGKGGAGIALTNSISIFLTDVGCDLKFFAKLLSHESFHTWNGVKLTPKGGSLSWFTEGFTEYYAEKLNFQSGLISKFDFIEHINAVLYEYYLSPSRNEKNGRISRNFWTNADIQKLPYLRGFLFALHWDEMIKKESHNRYSLDDLMLALLEKSKRNQYHFTFSDIEERAKEFLSKELVRDDLIKYILNGDTLLPEDLYLDNLYTLEWSEDIGFNLHHALSYGWIKGVKKGTLPFKSGLRDGQKFSGYQKDNQKITVYISEQGQIREITYLIREKLVPEFKGCSRPNKFD
jgi:predicted metalloprotease with PDZ domain